MEQRQPTDNTHAALGRTKNALLRALPDEVFRRLSVDLETISTTAKQRFHKRGEQFGYVYFPNEGVISVTATLGDGTMVETGTVGPEGVVGIEAFFTDAPVAAGETIMQVPGRDAVRLHVAAFRAELARQGPFARVIGRYAQASLAQMMQCVACNARHDVQERCCRWLLMTQDRVGANQFELSQEFLGMMLGVRRQSVTVVAGVLQAAGLITYKHGTITITDRHGLESAACECYALVRAGFDTPYPLNQL
jgi:CRP-like cAMP-binding protein